jgi:putative adenylate-forming enzyme
VSNLAAILWHYAAAKRNARRWRSRAELEAWQDRAVQKHLARILPRSPFYRQLYAGRSLSGWREFPTVSKTEMMASFDNWNTVGIRREAAFAVALKAEISRDFAPMIGNITIGLSSGTSGSRGLFLVSPSERHAWAGNLLAKILPGGLFEHQRAALCFRANSNLYGSVKSRRFQFGFFDLLETPEKLAQKLGEFQPTLLIAPPAMLRLLAEEKRAGRLKIQPTRIFSVAEVLEPQERAAIEKQFGQRLHEIYQATEGFLATTCAHGTLHLNEDGLVVQKEWLDRAQKKFTPVITDFRRTTQPVLRYRLNDILTERDAPCPCGSIFTALEKIEGRCDDLLRLTSTQPGGTISIFPDFIRRAVITADDTITEYSVTQRPDGKLEIALEVPRETRARAEQSVRAGFASLCETHRCRCPEIIFVLFVTPSLNVKRRRVQLVENSAAPLKQCRNIIDSGT